MKSCRCSEYCQIVTMLATVTGPSEPRHAVDHGVDCKDSVTGAIGPRLAFEFI